VKVSQLILRCFSNNKVLEKTRQKHILPVEKDVFINNI